MSDSYCPTQEEYILLLGDDGGVLYVGLARSLRTRFRQHQHASLFEYLGNVRLVWIEGGDAELEKGCIRHFRPRFNVNHVPVEKIEAAARLSTDNGMLTSDMEVLTTAEAGNELGVSAQRVRMLIREGRLPAIQKGRDWFVKKNDLRLVRDRKLGRPPRHHDIAKTVR